MIITLFLLIFTISYGQHSNYKSLKTKLPIPLLGHITAIYNNDLFVFGGKNGNKFNDKFWKLPLSSFNLNMTNLDIINEPLNIDWMQIPVKPPTYGSASNIGIGSNTFVCENQCSVLVNQYLYIFGSGSFALKQNNFINTVYRLDLSQDPPIFAFENDLPITNLNNAKPFCVTAAMGKIYINTPFKTIQYDPMSSELQSIDIKYIPKYNFGCAPNFREENIYLLGGNNDSFDAYSYSIGTNTNSDYKHLNSISRNNIKCISLGLYSHNIECPGGLDMVNHSYPQNSIIWNTYNNSQTYISLQTSVSQYGLEYYQFYTGTNYNSSIVLVIGGGNNERGTVKAIDTIQYAIIYENKTNYNQTTTNWRGSYKPTNELRIDVAERLQSQITRRRLGEKKCPKDVIKSEHTKTRFRLSSPFTCTNNDEQPKFTCTLDTTQQSKCPQYQNKDLYSHAVTKTLVDEKCIYTKDCTRKIFHCPAERIKHKDTKPGMTKASTFRCNENWMNNEPKFLCKINAGQTCPWYEHAALFSHSITKRATKGKNEEGQDVHHCEYTKHCKKKIFHCPLTNTIKHSYTQNNYFQSEFTCAYNKPIAEFSCKLQNEQQDCPVYENKNKVAGLSRASYVVSGDPKEGVYCHYTKYCEKGKMLDCPKKNQIKRSDTKSHGRPEGLTCHNPNWKCKSTTTCPKYSHDETKEQAVDQGDNKDRTPDDGVCEYTKICECPTSLDANHVKWKGWGDFKCHYQNGGQHDFKCIIKKPKDCPEYNTYKDQSLGLSVEKTHEAIWDSHTLHTTHEICVYRKVCPPSTIAITGAQFKEQKTICEKAGACNIICSPTYCQNEYIKASSGVTDINVYCEKDYSCIGEVKINGAVRDKDWGSGFQHRKDGINGKITCGWGNVQACQQSFFGYRKLTNAYFDGNATNTQFIFKNIGNKFGRPGVVKIDVSAPVGASPVGGNLFYSAPFSGNSILTDKVKRFELNINATAMGGLSASFIDLRGLLNKNGDQKQVKIMSNTKPSIGAHLICAAELSCNGVILLVKTCGGPIDIECNGKRSCNKLQIIIQVLKQCGHTSDESNLDFKNFKVSITSTLQTVSPEEKANIYVLFAVKNKWKSIVSYPDSKLNVEAASTRTEYDTMMGNQMKKMKALLKNTNNKNNWDFTTEQAGAAYEIYSDLTTYKAMTTLSSFTPFFRRAKSSLNLLLNNADKDDNLKDLFAGLVKQDNTDTNWLMTMSLVRDPIFWITSGYTVLTQIVKWFKDARHERYYYIDIDVEQAVPIPAGEKHLPPPISAVEQNTQQAVAKTDYYDYDKEQYEMYESDKHRSIGGYKLKRVQNPYNQKIHKKNKKNIDTLRLKKVQNGYDKKIHKKHKKSTRIL